MRNGFAALGFMAALLFAPAAAADITDSHLAAALDVIAATNAQANMQVLVDTVNTSMIGQVKQSHPNVSDKTVQALQAAFKAEMAEQLPELLKMQAAVFAEHFSETDLKALAGFYRSEVGQRFVAEQPAIIKEVTPIAFKWGQEAAKKSMERALKKLKKEGVQL